MGHPMKNIWFHSNFHVRPMAVELNKDSRTSTTQAPPLKRKMLVKHAFFRGDPREFLG